MRHVEAVIRQATADDVDALSSVMADALITRPVSTWLVADAAKRRDVLRCWARLVLTQGLAHGQVDTTDDHTAATVWYPRPEPPPPAAAWMYDLQRTLGSHAPRFALLHAYVDAVLPHTPHHYLAHLAARPGQSGAARALLTSYHRRLDAEGLPAHAELSGVWPRESVFARLGFEPRSPVLLQPGGPVLWRLWRSAPGDRRSARLPCRMRAHRFAIPLRRRAVPASPGYP
ncbi:N-acetyltransferase [Micromonospora sp. BQ11]|uniref:N-acetyltransferase n=1 Tax=Micromonospora sp. BQ11 TaxID=3452212 RepID=UPI003F89CC08